MKQYDDYYDDSETEERVQVAQETCENGEDILEAIERSKRQLKHSKVPFGYEKLDEEIITTVYKLPENEIIHRSNEANIEEINHRIIKEKYITNKIMKIKEFIILLIQEKKEIQKMERYIIIIALLKIMDIMRGKIQIKKMIILIKLNIKVIINIKIIQAKIMDIIII